MNSKMFANWINVIGESLLPKSNRKKCNRKLDVEIMQKEKQEINWKVGDFGGAFYLVWALLCYIGTHVPFKV